MENNYSSIKTRTVRSQKPTKKKTSWLLRLSNGRVRGWAVGWRCPARTRWAHLASSLLSTDFNCLSGAAGLQLLSRPSRVVSAPEGDRCTSCIRQRFPTITEELRAVAHISEQAWTLQTKSLVFASRLDSESMAAFPGWRSLICMKYGIFRDKLQQFCVGAYADFF